MKLTRTANAGVLLELDGVTILMDGVCREVKPYPATPLGLKAKLLEDLPEIIAFTHAHKDHYDPGFAAVVTQKNRVIFGPSTCHGTMEAGERRGVKITPIASRHLGAAGKDTPHASFLVEGSQTVLFTGDAAPTQWRQKELPAIDALIVPYAYCNTPPAWDLSKSLGVKTVVLVHMPEENEETKPYYDPVRETVGRDPLYVPLMEETLEI